MATYLIGDVHGCLKQLRELLLKLDFSAERDELWFTGDLINRGPDSLGVLEFLSSLSNCNFIWGNHDLHALALYYDCLPASKRHSLADILGSDRCEELFAWLRTRGNLIKIWPEHKVVLTHAGVYPTWSMEDLVRYAEEVYIAVQQQPGVFFARMYGNEPCYWSEGLVGWPRMRCIVNILTRMRYLTADLGLDFTCTDAPTSAGDGALLPWHALPLHYDWDAWRLVFGHWASLQANTGVEHALCLDGGCVWGGKLLGWCLDTGEYTSVAGYVE